MKAIVDVDNDAVLKRVGLKEQPEVRSELPLLRLYPPLSTQRACATLAAEFSLSPAHQERADLSRRGPYPHGPHKN